MSSSCTTDRPRHDARTQFPAIALDGAHGEGGGQLVRTAVALAAITGRAVTIENVRANRPKPGFAPQHVAAVRALGALCDADIERLAVESTTLAFTPGRLHGGEFRFDVGTAGSVTLVLQALLPALVACAERCVVTITGGTDVRGAPPLDYFEHVTLPLVSRMGVQATLVTQRRGYYPRGGGVVVLSVAPSPLRPAAWVDAGPVRHVDGVAHVAAIDVAVARRMRDAFLAAFEPPATITPRIDAVSLAAEQAVGAGGAIVAWVERERSVLGAGRVAQRGVPAELLAQEVARELQADLLTGAAVDVYAADQLLVYLALARGGSFTTRLLSSHAHTAIWLLKQFLPVHFACFADGPRVRVEAIADVDGEEAL